MPTLSISLSAVTMMLIFAGPDTGSCGDRHEQDSGVSICPMLVTRWTTHLRGAPLLGGGDMVHARDDIAL